MWCCSKEGKGKCGQPDGFVQKGKGIEIAKHILFYKTIFHDFIVWVQTNDSFRKNFDHDNEPSKCFCDSSWVLFVRNSIGTLASYALNFCAFKIHKFTNLINNTSNSFPYKLLHESANFFFRTFHRNFLINLDEDFLIFDYY